MSKKKTKRKEGPRRTVSNRSLGALKSSNIRKASRGRSTTIVIAGQPIPNTRTDKNVFLMYTQLRKAKYAPKISQKNLNRKSASIACLGALNISVEHSTVKKKSYLAGANTKERPQNPYIIDPSDITSLQNTKETPFSSFPSVKDPFYVLDEGAPDYYLRKQEKLEQKAQPDVSALVNVVYTLNMPTDSKQTYKLKQFRRK